MSTLQIRKLESGTFKHIDSIDGSFFLGKFSFKQELNKAFLVEAYGAKRREYSIDEISVYNFGGAEELFTNWDDLFNRLTDLGYTGIETNGIIPVGDYLPNQITDYTNATLPLTGTENLILNDGTGWKKLTWTNIKAQLKTYFDTLYQSILVSGTNIKTINGTSVLGSGDLVVSGGGGTLSKYVINFSFGSTWLGNLNANWRTSLYATNTNIYDNSIGANISQFNGTTNTLTSATDNRYTSWTLPYNCKLKEVISHMGGPLNVNIDFKIIYWEAPTAFGQSNFTYLGRVYYPISATGGKIFPTISELNTTTTLNKGGHVLIVWFNNTANPSFTTSLIQAIFEEV